MKLVRLLVLLLSLPTSAQVVSEQFVTTLASETHFGSAIAALGDLDGDGVGEVAVGLPNGQGGVSRPGVVYIFFLAQDFSVRSQSAITAGFGGFTGILDDGDEFGHSLANLGDRDGDGNLELAVGAPGDDDAGSSAGAVWVLSLRQDGTVASHRKITEGQSGFSGPIASADQFGCALGAGQDVDGDGHEDLVVSAQHPVPGEDRVYLLRLDAGRASSRARCSRPPRSG